ncbi:MAG: helix-turn-helix domain-containing protein, partial [Clostridia bacterium]|nr:helix-turn-helix domain-containing protein [Clostridia bacterium]
YYWELGKRTPNAQAVVTLAKYFGVTTDYLLGESD